MWKHSREQRAELKALAEGTKPISFADGRGWEPLGVTDGRPRVLVTLDEAGRVHYDHWNIRPGCEADFYADASFALLAESRNKRQEMMHAGTPSLPSSSPSASAPKPFDFTADAPASE